METSVVQLAYVPASTGTLVCDTTYLNLVQVGDRVGVQRCANGTMHVLFNGEDLGPAAQGIAEVYAYMYLSYLYIN